MIESNKLKFIVLAISCLTLVNCKQSQNETVSLKGNKKTIDSDSGFAIRTISIMAKKQNIAF